MLLNLSRNVKNDLKKEGAVSWNIYITFLDVMSKFSINYIVIMVMDFVSNR